MHNEGGWPLRRFGTAAAIAALAGEQRHLGGNEVRDRDGWVRQQGTMAPFDDCTRRCEDPYQAQREGRRRGRPFRMDLRHAEQQPRPAKSCARTLLGKGRVIFVTCDVDFLTPVVQEAINRGKLTIAPCIGTDQMGQRFGAKESRVHFGNVAGRGVGDGRVRDPAAGGPLQPAQHPPVYFRTSFRRSKAPPAVGRIGRRA
jgi:hypothetical protein